jgi:hypothetical protein
MYPCHPCQKWAVADCSHEWPQRANLIADATPEVATVDAAHQLLQRWTIADVVHQLVMADAVEALEFVAKWA